MSEQNLYVKSFYGPQIVIDNVGTVEHAKDLWDGAVASRDCDAAYIYRNGRIVASWDAHAQYLRAIGDIDEEEYEEIYYARIEHTDEPTGNEMLLAIERMRREVSDMLGGPIVLNRDDAKRVLEAAENGVQP